MEFNGAYGPEVSHALNGEWNDLQQYLLVKDADVPALLDITEAMMLNYERHVIMHDPSLYKGMQLLWDDERIRPAVRDYMRQLRWSTKEKEEFEQWLVAGRQAQREALGFPSVEVNPASLREYLHREKPPIESLLEPQGVQWLNNFYNAKPGHWAIFEQYFATEKFPRENTFALRKAIIDHRENGKNLILENVESLAHLQRNKPEPMQYQHDQILPLSGLMVVGGRPKLGKSYLMLNLAIAIGTGGKFIGHFDMAYPGPVLYMALEDNRQRMSARTEALMGPGATWPENVDVVYGSPRMDDGKLCHELKRWIEARADPRLIIIDIFARVKPRGRPKENVYDADYEAVAELATLAMGYGLNVAIVTHLTKNHKDVDDIAEAIMGSTGITGGTSTIWAMSYVGTEQIDASLYVTGKDVPRWEVALKRRELDGAIDWEYLGNMEHVGQGEARIEFLRTLYQWDGGRNPTPKQIRDAIGKNAPAFTKLMQRLKKAGLIRLESGRVGLTNAGAETIKTQIYIEEEGKKGNDGNSGNDGNHGNFYSSVEETNIYRERNDGNGGYYGKSGNDGNKSIEDTEKQRDIADPEGDSFHADTLDNVARISMVSMDPIDNPVFDDPALDFLVDDGKDEDWDE